MSVTRHQCCSTSTTASPTHASSSTRAQLSVSYQLRVASAASPLYAANNTRIPVYCRCALKLDFNLRRSFEWTFYVGAVSQAILGADFLQYFNLMVDVRGQRLMDPLIELSTSAKTSGVSTLLSTINHQFADILKAYPALLQPCSPSMLIRHNVMHHIETTAPPVHAKITRLVLGY